MMGQLSFCRFLNFVLAGSGDLDRFLRLTEENSDREGDLLTMTETVKFELFVVKLIRLTTVSVISSDPPFKTGNARLTWVPLNLFMFVVSCVSSLNASGQI